MVSNERLLRAALDDLLRRHREERVEIKYADLQALVDKQPARPLGWVWRGAGTSLAWKFIDSADMVREMRERGGYEIKAVYE